MFGLGSAGTPSLAFSGDTNTGIFSPGADTIAFAEGGTEVMRIDSSGNMGIGTSSPNYRLESQTAITVGLNGTSLANTTAVNSAFTYADPGTVTTGDGKAIAIGMNARARAYIAGVHPTTSKDAIDLAFWTTTGAVASERMRITSGGIALIGTTSASGSSLLQVNSDALINGLTVGKGTGSLSNNTAFGLSALSGASLTGNFNTAFGMRTLESNTSGEGNTAVGRFAVRNNTTGSNITGIGFNALTSNTTANNNVGVGNYALQATTTGGENTALGFHSLYSNTTASNNTAVGYQAAYSNTTGTGLTAVGYYALRATTANNNVGVGTYAFGSNTTGTQNAGLGFYAGLYNTTGSYNVAIGGESLFNNTTASFNTAVGYQSLYTNTTGANSTCVGYQAGYATNNNAIDAFGYRALYSNTSGYQNAAFATNALILNTTGVENSAFGNGAMYSNTTGSSNTAVGKNALYSNTTSNNNTAVGYQAGYSNTTGASNTFIGRNAGFATTTSGGNVFVGVGAGLTNITGSNCTYVGEAAGGLTTGITNTFIGNAAGYQVTTGTKNTIIGTYQGNQGNLDIRTSSNWVVISDGDGTQRIVVTNSGATKIQKYAIANFTKLAIPSGTATSLFKLNSPTGQVYGNLEIQWSYDQPGSNLYVGTIKGRAFWNGGTSLFDGTTTTGDSSTVTWSVFGDSSDLYFRFTHNRGVNVNLTYTVIWNQYNPGVANVDTSTIGAV